MTNFSHKNNILRLFSYQPLIKLSKEWQRRLEETLQQKIWLSPFSALNDPFERNFKLISEPSVILSNDEFYHFYFNFFKNEDNDLTHDKFKSMLNSSEFKGTLAEANNSLIKGVFSDYGIACFTSDYSNIPMWAHYANKHRGYCIIYEIDMPASLNNNSNFDAVRSGEEIITFHYGQRTLTCIIAKVKYTNIPPVIHLNELYAIRNNPYELQKYLANNLLGIKYHQWRYEEEFRLIVNMNSVDANNTNFHLPDFIRVVGVIVGSEVTQDEKNIFQQLCKKYKNILYQAKCSDTDYKIIIDLINNYSIEYA